MTHPRISIGHVPSSEHRTHEYATLSTNRPDPIRTARTRYRRSVRHRCEARQYDAVAEDPGFEMLQRTEGDALREEPLPATQHARCRPYPVFVDQVVLDAIPHEAYAAPHDDVQSRTVPEPGQFTGDIVRGQAGIVPGQRMERGREDDLRQCVHTFGEQPVLAADGWVQCGTGPVLGHTFVGRAADDDGVHGLQLRIGIGRHLRIPVIEMPVQFAVGSGHVSVQCHVHAKYEPFHSVLVIDDSSQEARLRIYPCRPS